MPKAKIVVLISGSGSNLQAIIDACKCGEIDGNVVAVISNKANAYGLTRATDAGIETAVLDHKQYPSREQYDADLAEVIESFDPDLVVLAGFMRILTAPFVQKYCGKMLNIHPSLLPKYQGLNTHQRAIEAGDKEHGVSVHFVTEELDGGPVVLQARVRIDATDNAQTLAQKVHQQEHLIYPKVVQWFAERRLRMKDNVAILDEKALPPTGHQA